MNRVEVPLPAARFRSRLDACVADAAAHARRLVVLVIELDRFDLVTSGLGRAAGDDYTAAVADRIAGALPPDTFATALEPQRLAVVPGDAGWSAVHYADTALAALEEPFDVGGYEVTASASIGIARYGKDGIDVESLLESAERASVHVKAHGGNGALVHEPEMQASAIDRLELEAALRGALDRGELWVAYQPRVDIATGAIHGAEALVRWDHPTLGSIPPSDFVPIAEETGLITIIGEWVLETACRQVQAWDAAGMPPITMAVNVSPRQFELVPVATMVRDVLARTGLPSDRLELELTESVDLQDPHAVSVTLAELRLLGVHCAIDDFGTGYSCLSHLTHMPIAALKIDRAFTRRIGRDPDSSPHSVVVLTVLELANRLDLLVVAEGVETAGQLDFLRRHGCAQAQGYLFSRPVPGGQFEELLRTGVGDEHDVVDLRDTSAIAG
jgi:predicted signal transduction protein with EAL and GGDEF domain